MICGYPECFVFPLLASSFRAAGVSPLYCGKEASQHASLFASGLPLKARPLASFAEKVVDKGISRAL